MVGQAGARSTDLSLSARRRAGARVKGHARAAEPGISTIYRKLYYNPDGHGRENEWDFVTYFECADEHLATFDQICRVAPRRAAEPGMALRHRRARVAGHTRVLRW